MTANTNQGIGQELRRIRQQKGLSQTDIFERVRLAIATQSRIENGHNTPGNTTLSKYEVALELPPGYFTKSFDSLSERVELIEKRMETLYDLVDEVAELKRVVEGRKRPDAAEARGTLVELTQNFSREELQQALEAIDRGEAIEASSAVANSRAKA